MLRTTVYLEEETSVLLRHLAAVHGRSQAELIREAIDTYVAQLEKQQVRLIPGAGKYRSGRKDVSERAEELLKKQARSNRK